MCLYVFCKLGNDYNWVNKCLLRYHQRLLATLLRLITIAIGLHFSYNGPICTPSFAVLTNFHISHYTRLQDPLGMFRKICVYKSISIASLLRQPKVCNICPDFTQLAKDDLEPTPYWNTGAYFQSLRGKFLTLIPVSQFELPQRAHGIKKEFSQPMKWMSKRVFSAWGIQTQPFSAP